MGMERYRTIIRLEEIRSLLESEEYEAAKEVADSIRKEKIKDSSDLFLLSAVYRKCGDFAMAKECVNNGCPPFSHSEIYRKNYSPAYRVAAKCFCTSLLNRR